MNDLVRLSLDETHALTTEIFLRHGVSADHARAIANTVTTAERDECKSHGLFRVPGYIASIESGKVTPDAVPRIHDLAPGIVRVDGQNGFAPLALEMGREPLIAKARRQGIAALSIVRAYHFAALWPEVEAVAEQGLVAFAFVSAKSFVAPAGGVKPLYGTNPMSFGWPRDGQPPLVFDQASSACARGEIQIHLRDGKPLPDGWAIDSDGNPTNDPEAALSGAQLPFGGYKGAAIALMVELLAGALIGDVFSFEASVRDVPDGGPSSGGELMIALDPRSFMGSSLDQDPRAHAETLFSRITEQPGTRLPSQRRHEARKRTPQEGITIPESLHDSLQALLHG